jgi:hypothetical protein
VSLSAGQHYLIIQGLFRLNRAKIARTLCIEKDIENSCCKGSCQLKKSLAKESSNNEGFTAENKQSEIMFSESEQGDRKWPKFLNERENYWLVYDSQIVNGINHPIFQPPEFV